MAKTKLKPKYRITHAPELFIKEYKNNKWVVTNLHGKQLGKYDSEETAKKAAVNHARRYLKVPRDYTEMYEQKSKGWELIYKEQMILPEDEQ